MREDSFYRVRIYFTGIVAIVICSILTWNYYHGGVPSHHILAKEDLPKISNLWGALLLPLLTWFLLYRVQKRIFLQHDANAELSTLKQAIYTFTISLVYGVAIACFFSFGYSDMTKNMMLGIFAIALFFPVYRAECLLGFVLGMTVTFGAILPTGIGSIIAIIAFVLFRVVRPAVLYIVSRFRGI